MRVRVRSVSGGSNLPQLMTIHSPQVAEELPEFSPRYVAYSYCHDHGDGRKSFPLCFIYYCPSGKNGEQYLRYASAI